MDITNEERAALRKLEKLVKDWPRTLGLFSNSGHLMVLKLDKSADFPTPGIFEYERRCVMNIGRKIPNDGGCLPYDGE